MTGRRDQLGLPAEPPGPAPVVAVVGRPNVGKSTLVNRLCRRSVAIVADEPGMTRDRVYAEATLGGRPVILVDTGGFDVDPGEQMLGHIRRQLFVAIEEAHVIVCLFDGSVPPGHLDQEIVDHLRRSAKPVVHVANKTESARAAATALEYHELGIGDLIPVSAAHGRGTGELVDAILARLPPPTAQGREKPPPGARLAIMGRPNAGKSTLVNTLLGEERMIVDERPGTTRDAVQLPVTFMGCPYVLIDTAGMRRRRSIGAHVEELSVLHAVRAMSVADVVLLLVDAADQVAEQDMRIANLALRRGRGLVVALNKWDAIEGRAPRAEFARPYSDPGSLESVPVVRLSGLTGWNLEEAFETVNRVFAALSRRIPTPELNRFLEEAVRDHQPPSHRHRPVRLNYATQTGSSPPRFTVFTNHPEAIAEPYRRYLENRLRKAYDLAGVPIRLSFRSKAAGRRRRSS
jgi:GTP-binding protein